MITTIEQKLSAIKAINEEKDRIDLSLQVIQSSGIVSINFNKRDGGQVVIGVDDISIVARIKALLQQHWEQRRQKLITDAEQLMK